MFQAMSSGAADDLSTERRALYDRALFWLVVAPFTFPMWYSLRRRDEELAVRLRWALWLNVAQTALLVVFLAAALWVVVVLLPAFARYAAAL